MRLHKNIEACLFLALRYHEERMWRQGPSEFKSQSMQEHQIRSHNGIVSENVYLDIIFR